MVTANSTSDYSTAATSVKATASGERACRAATVVSALAIIAIGVSVIFGWLTGRTVWVRNGSDDSVMVFNTALLFIASGTALIALAYHRFALMHLIGTALVFVASITALQIPLGVNLGIDELFFKNSHTETAFAVTRMAINSAICFTLLGLAFVVMRSPGRQGWRFFATALLASATMAISVVALFGHATGLTAAFGWRGTYGMAVPTAICFTIAAAWLIAWAARSQVQLGIPLSKWFPPIVGCAVIVGTLGLWHALVFQDTGRIQSEVHALFDDLYGDLKYTCHHHEGVLMRMAKRWNAGGRAAEANWRDDAKNYLDALKGFEALAWVDSNLEAKWIEVADSSDLAKTVAKDGALREMIQRARQQRVALAVTLPSGSSKEAKVWLCEPVLTNGTDDGCLLAVFDLRRLMAELLRRTPVEGQFLTIRDRQLVLFESVLMPGKELRKPSQTAELPFANLKWTVTDTPSQVWMAGQRSALPVVILGAGLLLSLLLTVSLQLAVWARESFHRASISEARFRAIFANAPMGIAVVDEHGRFLQANTLLQKMLGFSEEELQRKSFTEITHSDDLERAWTAFQELVTGKCPSYQIEQKSHGADGQSKWMSFSCARLPGTENESLAVAMVMNITERKLAERQLELQYRVTRLLSEDAEPTDTMQQVLQSVCELFEWDIGEVWTLDSKDSRMLRPLITCQQPVLEAREFVFASRRSAFSSGEGLPGRVWESRQATWVENISTDSNFPRAELARKSGLRSAFAFPMEFQNEFYGIMDFLSREIRLPDQSLLDTMASLGVLLGQFFHRKSSEQSLRETLALQQAILDNADRSIISSSPDGIIQVFNRAAERMLGYTSNEMVGRQTPAVLHDPEEIALRAKDLSQELGRMVEPGYDVFIAMPNLGVVEEREWTYVRKDQSHFPALLSVTAFRDSHRRITGYLGIANDITEQKRVEEVLRQAIQAAEDANKAKSEFLANMSHEIRTPMNGIIGMTNLALATPLRADQKEFLGIIKESGDALLTVVNDILDFSKVEAGKFDLEEIDFNLPDKLASAMLALSARAQEKGLELICDLDPAVPPWVSGDPGRLRQVIMNLVGNAIKFTDLGEVALRVTVEEPSCEDPKNCLVRFAVSDTGIGIPLEKQRIIFDPFSQADSSTTRRFGGTGLGLTISSRIVALMGGQIWVESEVGHGSTFHFTSRFNLASKPAEVAAVPQAVQRHAQGLHILVAEDNAINRLVAVRILELAGHSVVTVENGKEALSALEQSAFDIVLMDVQMPVMDGFEATALIRATEKGSGRHMPIVAMTAHAMKGDRERCLDAGMDGYVCKPIEEPDLFRAIETAVAGATLAAGPAILPIIELPHQDLTACSTFLPTPI